MRLIMATSYKENGCLPRVVAWWGRECFPLNAQMNADKVDRFVTARRLEY
jgi:hypothetical protein